MILNFASKYSSPQYNHNKKCDVRMMGLNKIIRKLTITEDGGWYMGFIIAFLVSIYLKKNQHNKKKTSPKASRGIQPFLIITIYHTTMKSRSGNRDMDN